MPHSLAARKRVRQNVKRRLRNRAARSALRTQIKKVRVKIGEGDRAGAEAELRAAIKKLDKTAQKGIIHPNAAARHKSRLSHQVNQLKTAQAAGQEAT